MEKRKDSENRILRTREYQRPNGTYEYRFKDRCGNEKSVYAKSLSLLRDKEELIDRDVLDGMNTNRYSMTVNDLYDRWESLKCGLKENTLVGYRFMYERFVRTGFGRSNIAGLRHSDVRAFYRDLAREKKLKLSTVENIHTVLHQVLEMGVEDDWLRHNPADNALRELKKDPLMRPQKKNGLTVKQQKVFEEYLKRPENEKWRPFYTVLMWTGIRVGEATGLRWRDIDFENGIISINHTLVYFSRNGHCGYVLNSAKSRAGERKIPMLDRVKEALLEEKAYQKAHNIVCKTEVGGSSDFVFLNRFGGLMQQGVLNKALRRLISNYNKEASETKGAILLPDFTNHSLRHTLATRMVEAGFNLKAMQYILGHSDASTTLNVYAEASNELKRTELEAFDKFMSCFE